MFVPSESIFAEIHENFEAVVQRAHRARIVIVSPSLLMLSIQVMQAVLKDPRMREQAHLIQGEVVQADGGPRPPRRPRAQAAGPFRARPTRTSSMIVTSADKLTQARRRRSRLWNSRAATTGRHGRESDTAAEIRREPHRASEAQGG